MTEKTSPPTPEQAASAETVLVAKVLQALAISLNNNVGNRLTSELATGIYNCTSSVAHELLKQVEHGNND